MIEWRRLAPGVFGAAYLILIPAFAALFRSFAGEFYHSTVQFEAAVMGDERRLLERLGAAMGTNYWAHRSLGSAVPAAIDWNKVALFDLKPEGVYDFTFGLVSDPQHRPTEAGPSALRLRLDLFWRRTSRDRRSHSYPVGTDDRSNRYLDLASLFPLDTLFTESAEFQSPDVGYVTLSDSLIDALKEWARAERGFPSSSSGSWSRMLYLSATTVTTVGYGDILPISSRARIAVASEAVLGVVMVGLFLNAVASRLSPRGK